MQKTTEHVRLESDADWKLWGPYLSERAWGTVREDYSANGDAWHYFPHDMARSRAYRWNEDGLAGICDVDQHLCFAVALWNGRDPILKERLFGLSGPEGNHGEDVKEYYFYLDSTPTHSYMKMLYKYPQAEYPYNRLVAENARRGKFEREYELLDTGIFKDNRYFDVFIEYGKATPEDVLIRITAANRGPEAASLHVLPTLWFRNTWAWGHDNRRPTLDVPTVDNLNLDQGKFQAIRAQHFKLGEYTLYAEGAQDLLFTGNETNVARLFAHANPTPYVKDAFHRAIVNGESDAINPAKIGTKAAAHYNVSIPAGGSTTIRLRLVKTPLSPTLSPFSDFDTLFAQRQKEADEYYATIQPPKASADTKLVQRQAIAGMLWSKQLYHYEVEDWLKGDPGQPPPPPERKHGRNWEWIHLNAHDVLSMPDKWEYPWFAAWDSAFHCIPFALVDAEFAKDQLILLMREWYQHPNGEVPAYEWNFGEVNPPVFAWAAWRIYKIDGKQRGQGDTAFLERVFHKLLLSFTWWVNRKDSEGNNIFQGGFLGLDNVGVFDRSADLAGKGRIEQSDGTAWMGMFTLNMLTISLELAMHNPVYQDIATKFFEHFLYIAAALNNIGGQGIPLWNDEDEFFYDVLHLPNGTYYPLRLRSIVGLIPLFAVETIEPHVLDILPEFKKRLEWFLANMPEHASLVSRWQVKGAGERRLLALVRGHRMKRLLKRALDPNEFLGDYGVRSLSKAYAQTPYILPLDGMNHSVSYEPGESQTGLFGGNSNWRGPVWMPINYLLIEALQKFHHYYNDDFKIECPTGSGQFLTLNQIADFLSRRLISLFLRDKGKRRPVFGDNATFQNDPAWRDYIQFYEYFHGDTGAGLGASHQTGWTGLVAKLIQQQGGRPGIRDTLVI